MLHTSEFKKGKPNYRIVGNFQWKKLSQSGENTIFAEKTYADCSFFAAPKDATPQISQRKLLRIATKPWNSWKFSPSKVLRYTVFDPLQSLKLSSVDSTTLLVLHATDSTGVQLHWIHVIHMRKLIKNACFMPAYLHGYPHTITW